MGGIAVLKAWFQEQTIKNKIIAIYIPLIIIPLFLLSYISNYIFSRAIIDKAVKNTMDESKLIITRINAIIDSAESCSNIIMADINKVMDINTRSSKTDELEELSQINAFELRNQIHSQLKYALIAFTDVESAAFIDTDSNIYSTDSKLEKGYEKYVNSNIFKRIEGTNGKSIWFPMQTREYLVINKDMPVTTLGKKIIKIDSQDILGQLILNIKETSFSSIYKSIGPAKGQGYFIIDQKGIVVSSQNKDDILKPIYDEEFRKWIVSQKSHAEVRRINGKKTLVTSVGFQDMDWILVNEIPLEVLTADTAKIRIIIILIGLICMVFAILGAGILSKVIANPIGRLTKNMLKVCEGNLTVNCRIDSPDEVGLLASGFNRMMERINDLLMKVEQEQKKKREIELALIQAQIKPHFLYNTLDTIYILSKMGREDGVQKTTKALADFYRIALSKGREVITVEEEVKNVSAYLSIQKVRYEDIFDFNIDVQEDIMHFGILKLTIQPLVENSIYHGLKTKGSKGTISIRGFLDDGRIIIKVTDDGIGISGEAMENALKSHTDKEKNQTAFGLRSVNERIKLYFGDDYGLTVNSKEGAGTEIIISLPASMLKG